MSQASSTTPFWVAALAVLIAIPTVLFSLAAAIGVTGYVDGVTADHDYHGSAPLAAGQTVVLQLTDAGADVVAGADGVVTVDDHAVVRAATRDLARRVLDRYTTSTVAPTGDGVAVTVGHTPTVFATSFHRDVTVHVPTGAHVVLRATNGAARLRGLSGSLDLHSANGAFDLEDVVVSESVKASANNGAIQFHGRIAGGSLDLSAHNGAINLVLPADTNATYDLETSWGAINVARANGAPQSTSGLHGTLTGRLGDGTGGSVVARTNAGAINLDARG